MNPYDLIVIGSGTAASGVATAVAAKGWKVAVVDFRPLGGTCALRGCDPKKVLIGAAKVVADARRLRGKGVAGNVSIDWPPLMAFKRGFTDPVPQRTESRLSEAGVDVLHGRARFVADLQLEIDGSSYEARHVVIASGAEPVTLKIMGESHLITSEQFLSLDALPPRVVFVGGGYIAGEFAHLAATAGVQVTVVQHADRLLTAFDPDLVELATRHMRELGIDVQLRTRVEGITANGSGFTVHGRSQGRAVNFDADLVVHAAGRKPDLASLNLAAAHVDLRDGRLDLDEFLRSKSNPKVFAAGDASQLGPALTPVASRDAKAVANNLLNGDHLQRPDHGTVPSVAFLDPPIAAVGLSEEKARSNSMRVQVKHEVASGWFTARRINNPVYAYKTIVDEASGRLVGAHLLGPAAAETINVFALAIRQEMSAQELRSTIFAYPTAASDIGYMFDH